MKKRNWKLNIRRVDVERMLILCASALVVALALRQDQTVPTRQTQEPGRWIKRMASPRPPFP